MKANVKIDWSPAKLEENLKNNEKIIKKGMQKGLEKIVEAAATGGQEILSQRAATVGNKNIQESLSKGHAQNISKALSHQQAQVGTKYPGANLVKQGTKPHRPPWSSIENWVRQNAGVLGVGDIGSATHSFREHITRKGTKATNFLSKGIKHKEKEIKQTIEEAAEEILKDMGLN